MYTPRELAEYAAFRATVGALAAIPLPTAQRLAARAARALFDRGGKRVDFVLTNLRIAYPNLPDEERRRIGRESYVNFAWGLIDVARGRHWTRDDIRARVDVEGMEIGNAAMGGGKGVAVLGLHMGSFEVIPRAAPAYGFPLTVIGRPVANRLFAAELLRQRQSTGAEMLLHRDVLPKMLRAVKKGRAVAVLNDQYTRRSRGVFVPFLGVRASTSLGLAVLALRSGAPVVPVYVVRVGPDHHRMVIRPPLETPDTGDRRKDAEILTTRANEALGEIIRAHPEQWMWSHRRFRHSPDLPGDPYGGR
jgi:KDO2-lipid IV(A) lauroyltransferase